MLINRLDPQIFAIREQKIPLEKLGLDVREHWFDLEEAFGLQPSDYLNGLSFEAAEKIYWAFNNYALLQNLRSANNTDLYNPSYEISARQIFDRLEDIIERGDSPTVQDLMTSLNIDNKLALEGILGKSLDLNDRLTPGDLEMLKTISESAMKAERFGERPDQFIKNINEVVEQQLNFNNEHMTEISKALDHQYGIPQKDVPGLYSLFDLHQRLTTQGLDEGLKNLYQLLSDYEYNKHLLNNVFGIQSPEEAARLKGILDAYNSIKDNLKQLPDDTIMQIKKILDPQSNENGHIALSFDQTKALADLLNLPPDKLQEVAKSVAQNKLPMVPEQLNSRIAQFSKQLGLNELGEVRNPLPSDGVRSRVRRGVPSFGFLKQIPQNFVPRDSIGRVIPPNERAIHEVEREK